MPSRAPELLSVSTALARFLGFLLLLVTGCLSTDPLLMTLDEQRAENLRVYELEASVSAVPDGSYVAIAQGRLLESSTSIEGAQALIRAQRIGAQDGDLRHAFLYQQGQTGDLDYDVHVAYPRWDIMGIGAIIAAELRCTFDFGPDGTTVLMRGDRRVEFPLELGAPTSRFTCKELLPSRSPCRSRCWCPPV